jgi:hypothetical protein
MKDNEKKKLTTIVDILLNKALKLHYLSVVFQLISIIFVLPPRQ